MRGEIPSLPDPTRVRGDTLSTRSSSCAGRYPLYPILPVCGEIPSLPDHLRARGDALYTRPPSSHDDDDNDDDDDDDDDDGSDDEDQVCKGL